MYASNDSLSGSPTFTVKTAKVGDHYEAHAPQIPDLPAEKASSEVAAIRQLQSAITSWLLSGASPKRSR